MNLCLSTRHENFCRVLLKSYTHCLYETIKYKTQESAPSIWLETDKNDPCNENSQDKVVNWLQCFFCLFSLCYSLGNRFKYNSNSNAFNVCCHLSFVNWKRSVYKSDCWQEYVRCIDLFTHHKNANRIFLWSKFFLFSQKVLLQSISLTRTDGWSLKITSLGFVVYSLVFAPNPWSHEVISNHAFLAPSDEPKQHEPTQSSKLNKRAVQIHLRCKCPVSKLSNFRGIDRDIRCVAICLKITRKEPNSRKK